MADKAYQIFLDGEPVAQAFYGDVVSLTVEENTGIANALHLRLALSKQDDGSWNHLDDTGLAPFGKIAVKVGFQGGQGLAGVLSDVSSLAGNTPLEPVFDGYVTALDVSLGSQPNDTFLDVHALDTSVLMSLEEKVAAWIDLADSEIVQQIVAAYGVSIQAESTPTVHQENDTVVMQRGTDIQFVRELARRNGVEFYFETDQDTGAVQAFFRAPDLDAAPQPDLAVQFGEQSNLRTFAVRLEGQRPTTARSVQMDIASATPNEAEATETLFTKLGDTGDDALITAPAAAAAPNATPQILVLGAPSSDPTELQTVTQAVRDEAAWFLQASGEINSDAYGAVLRPHRVVLLKGAGSQYSGKYYVTRVVHQLKTGGAYSQSFEARRNARDLDQTEQFGTGGLGAPIPGL
jgi:phage protein D